MPFAFVCLVELHDLTFSLDLLLMLKAARARSFSGITTIKSQTEDFCLCVIARDQQHPAQF